MVTHVATIMNFQFACRITSSASEDWALLHRIQLLKFLGK